MLIQGQVAEFIEDKQLGGGELAKRPLKTVVGLGGDQAIDQVSRRGEQGLEFPLTGGDPDGCGEMGFSQTTGAEKNEVLLLLHKVELERLKDQGLG